MILSHSLIRTSTWQTFDIEARHAALRGPRLPFHRRYDTLLQWDLAAISQGCDNIAHRARALEPTPGRRALDPFQADAAIDDDSATSISGPQAGFDLERVMLDLVRLLVERPPTNVSPGALRSASSSWGPTPGVTSRSGRWRARPRRVLSPQRRRGDTLDGNGSLSDKRPADEPADRFVYDPWNPVPTGARGGVLADPSRSAQLERRHDVLVYTTAPLASPIEVTGPVEVRLWTSSSATDTDFTAKLVDVFPDGTARMLTDGILRARLPPEQERAGPARTRAGGRNDD